MSFIYLACPYSSPDPEVRLARRTFATKVAAFLMEEHQEVVFSPITHGHEIAEHLPAHLLLDHEFWMKQSLPYIRVCRAVVVLGIPGWDESAGVRKELELAKVLKVHISIIVPKSFRVGLSSCADPRSAVPGAYISHVPFEY